MSYARKLLAIGLKSATEVSQAINDFAKEAADPAAKSVPEKKATGHRDLNPEYCIIGTAEIELL